MQAERVEITPEEQIQQAEQTLKWIRTIRWVGWLADARYQRREVARLKGLHKAGKLETVVIDYSEIPY